MTLLSDLTTRCNVGSQQQKSSELVTTSLNSVFIHVCLFISILPYFQILCFLRQFYLSHQSGISAAQVCIVWMCMPESWDPLAVAMDTWC